MFRKQKTWSTFYSPVKNNKMLEEINLKPVNIIADWTRLNAKAINVTIDGISLSEVLRSGELRDKKAAPKNLQNFFQNTLLANLSEDESERWAVELMKYLHQGGILHPVSTAAAALLKDVAQCDDGTPQYMAPSEDENNDTVHFRDLAFVTTPDGFLFQEIVTQKAIHDSSDDSYIKPDPGKKYVYMAQATLQVKFNQDEDAPAISVLSNSISYGSKTVEKLLDDQNFMKKIISFFAKMFGKTKELNLSSPKAVDAIHRKRL